MDQVTNLFVHPAVAQRYASARPYFHPIIIRRIISVTGVSRFSHALDIACGTGQSSQALVEIADDVFALDMSSAMVTEAVPHANIRYQVARAEALAFPENVFDIATVGLAFHWFNQAEFLSEAQRVLKANAWLVVYTSGFYGEMVEDATFRAWAQEIYPGQFPTPPRRATNMNLEMVEQFGFTLRGIEEFTHDETMEAEQLIDYLLTQTNTIAAVEGSSTFSISAARNWIRDGINPFFKGKRRTMKFGGSISFLRRMDTA